MRILLVEDTPKHHVQALRVLKAAGIEHVIGVTTSSDALVILAEDASSIDGVITDLFMPFSKHEEWNHTDDPCGLAIALEAEQLGIPFVICTAGYHHGSRYNWICRIGRDRKWPEMVDKYDAGHDDESDSKDWAKALEVLLKLMEKPKQP